MHIIRMLAIACAAALSIAASDPHPDWTTTVAVSDKGTHVLGNPAAKVKLTEFVSYTCPHCAHFQKESDAPLRQTYIPQGKVSVEVQHLIRDPVDLTVAMLTNCGDKGEFFSRHDEFLRRQDDWLAAISTLSKEQTTRWQSGTVAERLRAIARDLGFYKIMEKRGFASAQVDRCLADEGMTKKIMQQTQDASAGGVQGTPSFSLNGTLLEGTHSWDKLNGEIRKRM